MGTRLILATVFLLHVCAFAQDKVNAQLRANDFVEFSIINVLPDSFPSISIIFNSYASDGEPLWDLKKKDFKVYEDGKECEIQSLKPISLNKPIHIAIVIDHSGSMLEDISQLFDKARRPLFSFDSVTFELKLPKGYVSPLDNAKSATREFVSGFNFKKDLISVVGFSSSVDKTLPLTDQKSKIDSVINSMESDSLTALYDAMLVGLDQLKSQHGVNVMVILTDGQNNKSKSRWTDVIDRAKSQEVPIFVIGLGSVNQDTLQIIADRTKGQFIYTETSTSFPKIYRRISNTIQAFYDLRYKSPNLSSIESKRKVEINFSSGLRGDSHDLILPAEVQLYLQNREKKINYLVGASLVTAIATTSGLIFYRRKRRKLKQK